VKQTHRKITKNGILSRISGATVCISAFEGQGRLKLDPISRRNLLPPKHNLK